MTTEKIMRDLIERWRDGTENFESMSGYERGNAMAFREAAGNLERLIGTPAAPKLSEGLTLLSQFEPGQWWVKELDAQAHAVSGPAYHDFKRAVAVVHNLLRTVQAINEQQPSAKPAGAGERGASYRWNEEGIQAIHTVLCIQGGLQPYELACAIKDKLVDRDLWATPPAAPAVLSDEEIERFADHAADRIPASNYVGRVLHAVRLAEEVLAAATNKE